MNNTTTNITSTETGIKLVLGPATYSQLLEFQTPAWIDVDGIRFFWDEQNGYYPTADNSMALYLEDEVLTPDSYWEIFDDIDTVPSSN